MITPSYSITATERVLPKLALDFTTATLDPRVTFTRATWGFGETTTYVNSSGYVTLSSTNTPRFDYDPVTLKCKGLLIEEQRVNSTKYNNNLNATYWTKSNYTITGTSGTSPDGTNNAWKLVSNVGTSGFIYNESAVTNGSAFAQSLYVKYIDTQWIVLTFTGISGVGRVWVDLQNGVFGSSTGQVTPLSVTNAGNGWYRVSVTATATGTLSGLSVSQASANGSTSFTGDGVKGLLWWGPQCEVGAFSTSYIYNPTSSGGATRYADVATMTGTNFSSWYNASEGSVLVNASNIYGGYPIYFISDGTATNRINLRVVSATDTRPEFFVGANNVVQADIAFTPALNSTSAYKIATAYKLNDFAMYASTGGSGTDNSGTVPSVNQLQYLGYNCILKQFYYYPLRLTNAQLQSLVH